MMKHEEIIIGHLYAYTPSGLGFGNIDDQWYRDKELFLLTENKGSWQGLARLSTGKYHTWTIGKTLAELRPIK